LSRVLNKKFEKKNFYNNINIANIENKSRKKQLEANSFSSPCAELLFMKLAISFALILIKAKKQVVITRDDL
jgi:hypothetical protein